jgi:hypothetical protein
LVLLPTFAFTVVATLSKETGLALPVFCVVWDFLVASQLRLQVISDLPLLLTLLLIPSDAEGKADAATMKTPTPTKAAIAPMATAKAMSPQTTKTTKTTKKVTVSTVEKDTTARQRIRGRRRSVRRWLVRCMVLGCFALGLAVMRLSLNEGGGGGSPRMTWNQNRLKHVGGDVVW